MKKNLIYLSVLAAITLIAFFIFKKEKRVFSEEDANFKVENVEDVTKIFLSDAGVGNIKLTKTDAGVWMVNDSFRARPEWVTFLLDGMSKQTVTQMVPQAMHNGAVKQLAGNGVKAEIYKGDKKTHSYFVAKDPSKDNLTVMLNIRKDGSNAPRPFLVACGYGGSFLGIRYATELENWRDKQFFSFPNEKIKTINVTYPKKPQASYSVVLEPVLNVSPVLEGEEPNAIRLEKYVSFYKNFFCMGFENEYILKDTFVKAFKPFAEVNVTSTGGNKQSLKLYYKQVNKTTHRILTVDGKDYDGDTFFGLLNNKDFVLISSSTAQKMLRERQEFFKSNTPASTSK